jgi:hypothetical protein
MEMEEKTCTIRLLDKQTRNEGILFFRDGQLLDARLGKRQGLDAAYEIFSWEQVNLSIKNECPRIDNRINSDLQPIILEAARKKDEAETQDETAHEPRRYLEHTPIAEAENSGRSADELRMLLVKEVGEHCGVEDICHNDGMDEIIFKLTLLSSIFQFGRLKLGYFDQGDRTDSIVLPGRKTTVISVNPKCPRDKILRVLNDKL